MAVIEWPREQFRLTRSMFHIGWESRSAGRGLSGHEQIISSGVGRWSFRFLLKLEDDRNRLKRFEALVAQMRGRLNSATIPILDQWGYDELVSPRTDAFSDGFYFDDGTGFTVPGFGINNFTVVGLTPAGSDVLTVAKRVPAQPWLRIGDRFSRTGWIHTVVRTNNAGWNRIEPPLRENFPDGGPIFTNPPMARVKFATDDEGQRARVIRGLGEAIELNFVEDFDR